MTSDPSPDDSFALARAGWLKAVERVLKGAAFDDALRSRTADGLIIEPLYDRVKSAIPITGRRPGTRWTITQRIDHPDPADANGLALADLEGGADGLALVLADSPSAHGFGVCLGEPDDVERIFDGIMLDLVRLRVEPGRRWDVAVDGITALVGRRGLTRSSLDISFGIDPVEYSVHGGATGRWGEIEVDIARTIRELFSVGHTGAVMTADGRSFHQAGASEAQELAGVLASAVLYLRLIERAGLSLDNARQRVDFVLTADDDIFLTIAKLRALRRLWASVEEACGLRAQPIRLHAETSRRMTHAQDPWTNMLRYAVAGFAAGIGGADSITVLPFTEPLGPPDGFARRIARNAQAVLMEEAHLHRVVDPVAGSGAFETLTAGLCKAAWTLFQRIEDRGGMFEASASGWWGEELAITRSAHGKADIAGSTPVVALAGGPPVATLAHSSLPRRSAS